jgi:hypothetical protein
VPRLLFTALVYVPAFALVVAALAAVTGTLLQYFWSLLVVGGLEIGAFAFRNPENLGWGNLEWLRSSALGAIILGASIVVLIVQYARRNTMASRGILSAAALVAAAGPFLGDWHQAFALESRFANRPMDLAPVRLSFEPSRKAPPGYDLGAMEPRSGETGIALPILVGGLPAGDRLVSERISATIQASGKSWTSAWTARGGIANLNPLEDRRLVRPDGAYWLYLDIDRSFYRAVKDVPVRLHASVAVTLLGGAQSGSLAPRGRTGPLQGDAICSVGPGPYANLIVTCAWPFRTPAGAYIQARSLRTGQASESVLVPPGPYRPFSLNGLLWDWAAASFSEPPPPAELKLETWQAVAGFERDLDIPQIRLGEYADRRIADPQ